MNEAPSRSNDLSAPPLLARDGQTHWAWSLCGWFRRPDVFCFSLFCPCVRLGLTAERAGIRPYLQTVIVFGVLLVFSHFLLVQERREVYKYDIQNGVGEYDNGTPGLPQMTILGPEPGVDWSVWFFARVFTYAFLFLRIALRWKLRIKYAIFGDMAEDAFLQCCCMPCSIAQEAAHVDQIELGEVSGCVCTPWPEAMAFEAVQGQEGSPESYGAV
mmetsp:Transcript_60761/g.131910  ORF Transcript_60761/g.131910 Transcript_60761/m.131910 type:complete len:215 (-) Transcript_60761:1621-2265(-)